MAAALHGAAAPAGAAALLPFIDRHCASCHDEVEKEGGLDLTRLALAPDDPANFRTWVTVHDRVAAGEMPPKKKSRPPAGDVASFIETIGASLRSAEEKSAGQYGRATRRRLNRHEYENALRDLLQAPWLQVKDGLPEDGEAHRFNKVGDALDMSHVQLARYLNVADYALRQVVARQPDQPETTTTRYHARDQQTFAIKMTLTRAERGTFPVLGTQGQPEVRARKAPITVGPADPQTREREAMGVVAGCYEPIELKFEQFRAPIAGRYRIRLSAYSVWVGPTKPVPGKRDRWWVPDQDDISPGRRPEPITLYAETPPRLLRRLGAFDVGTEPTTRELDVWLLQGETIRPDASRLFRPRPPNWINPLAQKDGMPGVAYRWLEVEGPIVNEWPTAGHHLLFGDLPLKKVARNEGVAGAIGVEVVSSDPKKDAERLLRAFTARAYRRPVDASEVERFQRVVDHALAAGSPFAEAMIVGYTAVLCSPGFLYLDEKPGPLDDYALASRLSFFLWNSAPDVELRTVAARGELRRPNVLRAQTERMLNDPKSGRFVNAFLDYWLDLRKVDATAADSGLYPDYYLDDLLTESSLEETRGFFTELLRHNLPARTLVASDFAMLNERLAVHYGLPPVDGVALRRVALPPDSPRGGLMTQAAVLKVTANGTTTSPVLRGAWIMERILGDPPPPPPPSVPAIEPDIRGTHTIRQLLEQHRAEPSCAACHVRIDPAGFALESFDVMGGWRDRYRAMLDGVTPATGIGHNGQRFAFHFSLPVDATGELPDGRSFQDVREFKRLLLADEKRIARNLTRQLTVYATGAPVRFSDREPVERLLARARSSDYGVRDLVHEIVQSELFLKK